MISQSQQVISRFAPSPTGRMHLGNIFTALISWLVARKSGGRWLLRIEDLDPQRSRLEYARLIEDDLHWLGLDWDEGGVDALGHNGPYMQSLRGDIYERALKTLSEKGLTYPCYCTKADIAATNAPHATDGRIIYPGTCRPAEGKVTAYSDKSPAIRLLMPHCRIDCADTVFGQFTTDMAAEWGDIVLRRADGAWAYQLAVVVDDAAMGVTHVVRGSDLLGSCAPQTIIASLLGVKTPRYIHLPLICNKSGLRLSKRDSSLAMDCLRRDFTSPQIIGKLAHLAGIMQSEKSITPRELIDIFDISLLPKKEKIILEE
ncbi:MAG: tRNA glutamyl-Q(34) synthetase GluQRS [Paramuribaculum sp.]|nr:tRNA glutamyl-Q(34) synthetase GluQRS [Paramuribaculum sp.]